MAIVHFSLGMPTIPRVQGGTRMTPGTYIKLGERTQVDMMLAWDLGH